MGKKEEFVKEITNIEDDFAKWYTDVVIKADLADYTETKGCIAIKPYGYAIWENIKDYADKKFKEVGITNFYMPLLIPESMLEKEKEHVEGFAPEVAWVTIGGGEELEERLCIRPTSETIISTMYAKWVKSWRDLPILGNQWCSVLRWEKETRPFLRSREFLWQEGHTIHETAKEAEERTLLMLDVYADVIENLLAIPVLKGKKTKKEQFAGADSTYTVETLMKDGRALQAGTSHYFGQNFSKPFNIKFQNREGKEEYVYQTSWGITTRLIGAVIMAHGDNRGLKLPPKVAPIQAVIVPIAQHKDGVLEKSNEIFEELKSNYRVKLDDRDNYSTGFKFNDWEMRGVPVRIEIGPKDIEKGVAVLVRRDNGEKETVELKNLNIRLSTDLVACGKEAGNYMYGNKKYTIINNAMDLEKYMFNKQKRNEMRKKYDIREENIVIGHIGRFTKQKNHEFIIYLFQKLLHKNKNFILFLVGNGEEQDKIKNIVREKHLEDKVIFAGIIDNTFEIYNLFDIFILPSLYEGMPVVSIEAQLSGLYCIFSSNIDEEALINTGKVKMLDLDLEIWKKNLLEIINYKNLSDREVVKKQFIEKGLDIVNETQKLEKIYRGEIE